jgi:hypothetical protein
MSHDPHRDGGAPQGEGGSFWTSYSDLLLGLSVIFLVLFFFATIRAGIEQMKRVATQEETKQTLQGKTSAQDVQDS